MIIDLTNLLSNGCEEISFCEKVVIPLENLSSTSIRSLSDVCFQGKIVRMSDNDFHIDGILNGNMVLPDDITLEDVDYPFEIAVVDDFNEVSDDNHLQIVQNKLDITEFLWQNILVEVPLKVKKPENEGLTLEGDGWRLITEEELNNSNNSPFSELNKMFDSGKE